MARRRPSWQTVDVPEPLPARRRGSRWMVDVGGVEVGVADLDQPLWPEGYTQGDVLAYYHHAAPWVLPYVRNRPLTLTRVPAGVDGESAELQQAPAETPEWLATAAVTSLADGTTTDHPLAQDAASLVWLASLGAVELHPWHARVDDPAHPDYAVFDLDPVDVDVATVCDVALLVRTALDHLGLGGHPRTSGAAGLQVLVPLDRRHPAATVRRFVEAVCHSINAVDPQRTTMAASAADRAEAVVLGHEVNSEGGHTAATYSLLAERGAPVAVPLTWDEVEAGIGPGAVTIATVWDRLAEVGDLGAPILAGGQDLSTALNALSLSDADEPARHTVTLAPTPPGPAGGALAAYRARRDFARTPEPAGDAEGGGEASGQPRFVIQHHLATRLHHDLRLQRDGVAVSWAVPKGLPDVAGLAHLAVHTEDHPLEYLDFAGDIPAGEYGAGPMRIWDRGTYETVEWGDDKVTVVLHGQRHAGEFHLFRTGEADPAQWMVTRAGNAPALPDEPPRIAPMLASDGPSRGFDDVGWTFEVKWDGVRAIATVSRPGAGEPGRTRLVSRAGNDVTAAYPELTSLWQRVLARNAVLDGEVVALDREGRSSFQRLQRRMHVRDERHAQRLRTSTPVTYMVFDLLAIDGESLVDRPLAQRLARLDEVLVPGESVQRSEGVAETGAAMFDAAASHGLEGLIAKRLASPYRPGKRSRDWLKLKVRRRTDVVIGGWLPGEGARDGRLGSLLVGAYDDGALCYRGRVGTGFDEAELARLGDLLDARAAQASPFAAGPTPPRDARWVTPDLVCRVEFAEITDDGVLRAPAYKGLVADADPGSCRLPAGGA